jgi:hypothetical protein
MSSAIILRVRDINILESVNLCDIALFVILNIITNLVVFFVRLIKKSNFYTCMLTGLRYNSSKCRKVIVY